MSPSRESNFAYGITRRDFLNRTATIGSAILVAPSLIGLASCSNPVSTDERPPGYGPVLPASNRDVPELMVPEGFFVERLSTTGQPSRANLSLANVGSAFDGMAVFALANGNVRLVRNHEVRGRGAPLGEATRSYDPVARGGTSTLEVRSGADGSVELVAEFVSLSGTSTNCAGGPTPWRSWISCEETTVGLAAGFSQPHGYCFEVPVRSDSEAGALPLKAMGRFVHEAVAVDPGGGIVYMTEDASVGDGTGAGFYRFIPTQRGQLAAGGSVEMLAVAGQPRYLIVSGQRAGMSLPVAWVPIQDPDPADAETNSSAVFRQGLEAGGAIFQRLEGCWAGDSNIYFNATSGGDAGAGQVWAYSPGLETLTLIFESPSTDVLDHPDNICVSPRGGIVLCEDGSDVQYLRGLTPSGTLFDLVATEGASAEFAGACFSPTGRTLFFNIQNPLNDGRTGAAGAFGGTYALWGPWEKGSL